VRRRKPSVLIGLAVAGTLVLTGCSGDAAPVAAAPAADAAVENIEATESAEPSLAPSESPSASASASPSASSSPKVAAPKAPAAPSYDVAAVQRKLTDLKYYGGAIDGKAGGSLRSAVMAFQKVQGLGADGAVGKSTLAALEAPKPPTLKGSSPANRVEVDLTKQVLYVVKGGAIARIMPVSSGNGATYLQKDGSKAKALTPTGYYKIQRRIVGERKADLGTLYDPQYFYKGWAIHGSNSVPAVPASHGCVRVTRADAKYLLAAIGNGMTVYLYGGTHAFTAGSSAPGTDTPTGDAPAPAPASSSPAPKPATASPAPEPSSPSPSSSPKPSSSPSSSPSPSVSPPVE
jgi:peptidoglycan hydrolase-like protein with peptidoglycan-binding domain